MPTINENGYHHYITDQQWFDDLRGSMRFAFGCDPALATLFMENKETKKAMCKHLYQNGEDGTECVKCNKLKWHEGAYQ